MFLFVSPFIYKKLKNQIKKSFFFPNTGGEHQSITSNPHIMSPLCYHASNNNNTTSVTIRHVSI